MKKNILFVFILVILILPNNIKAKDVCGYEDKTRLQRIASNISTSYTYKEEENEETGYNSVKFTVTISNMHNDIYLINEETGEIYKNNSSNEIIINDIKPGKYLKYFVYGNIDGCFGEKITTIYVTLPSFNKYYTDDICRNIPEYSLCNKWTSVKMTHDQFTSKVNNYLDSLIVKPDKIKTDNKRSVIEIIESFIIKYGLLIFGLIILITVGIKAYLIKKDRFDLSLK